MTELHVPAGSIAGMVFSLVVAWGLPLALLILIRRKQKADMLPVFSGMRKFLFICHASGAADAQPGAFENGASEQSSE